MSKPRWRQTDNGLQVSALGIASNAWRVADNCYFLQYPIDKILLLMSSFEETRKKNQMRAAFRRPCSVVISTIFTEFPFNFDLFFPCLFNNAAG